MSSKIILYFSFLLAKPTNFFKDLSFSFSSSNGICLYFQHSSKTDWILDNLILWAPSKLNLEMWSRSEERRVGKECSS